MVKSQSRQQRRQEHKGHRRGGPGVLRIQARRPEAVSDGLSRHTDEPADDEGQRHILSQRGLLLHPLHIRLILQIGAVALVLAQLQPPRAGEHPP